MRAFQRLVREFMTTRLGVASPRRPTVPDAGTRFLRARLVAEEAAELVQALHEGDLVKIADACGDLAYVVAGTAEACGFDLQAVALEVHRSNMTKDRLDKDGKGGKGAGYRPPDLARVLHGASR